MHSSAWAHFDPEIDGNSYRLFEVGTAHEIFGLLRQIRKLGERLEEGPLVGELRFDVLVESQQAVERRTQLLGPRFGEADFFLDSIICWKTDNRS